jgi:hypothetical protein
MFINKNQQEADYSSNINTFYDDDDDGQCQKGKQDEDAGSSSSRLSTLTLSLDNDDEYESRKGFSGFIQKLFRKIRK